VTSTQRYTVAYVLAAVVAALLFVPGLSGGFILDDFPNLALLNMLPADPAWDQILALSENGIAGVTGRPLALITFVLQADSWPDSASAFKLINLVIHLFNAALVMALLMLLGRNHEGFHLRPGFAGLVVLLWLVHPLQVSGVLYVVQRMNLLSSLFVLLGFVGYLWARWRYVREARTVYLFAMVLLPSIAVVPGVLSKENAVLLYGYLAVTELLLINNIDQGRRFFGARILAVGAPLLLIVAAGLLALPELLSGYDQKPFGLVARVLTQFPVLVSYLQMIVLPRQSMLGLFHDDFPVFNDPVAVAVLFSIALLLCALVWAWHYRRVSPVPAFMLLWFLTGHAIESSFLPLEMYFEHRNYLPLLGVLIGAGLLAQSLWLRIHADRRILFAAFMLLVALWPCWLTTQQARLWGDPLEHAYAEAFYRPDSRAAHANLVQVLANAGQVETALAIHLRAIDGGSESVSDYVRWLEFACLLPDIDLPSEARLQQVGRQAAQDFGVVGAMNRLIPAVSQGRCPAVSLASINVVLEALLANDAFVVSRPDLLQLRAVTAANAGDYQRAATLAGQSYELRRDE